MSDNWLCTTLIATVLGLCSSYSLVLLFQMYSAYSIAFTASQTTLAKLCRTCPELVDIIERVEVVGECDDELK